MNIIEYFDRTQIVSLAKRTDRRVETQNEFNKFGFPLNTENVSFFEAISPTDPAGFPSCGIRGCFMSHLVIFDKAIELGVKNILMLEDDIAFSKHILEYGAIAVEGLGSRPF